MLRLLILLIMASCSSVNIKSPEGVRNYPCYDSSFEKYLITVWDVYSPITYYIYFDQASHAVQVTFVTHRYKRNKVFTKQYETTGPVQVNDILELQSCSAYEDYICEGLDGSEFWVGTSCDNIKRYWSPESQPATAIGSSYMELKMHVERVINIDSLKVDFLTELPTGRYWNFGEGILSIAQ